MIGLKHPNLSDGTQVESFRGWAWLSEMQFYFGVPSWQISRKKSWEALFIRGRNVLFSRREDKIEDFLMHGG